MFYSSFLVDSISFIEKVPRGTLLKSFASFVLFHVEHSKEAVFSEKHSKKV